MRILHRLRGISAQLLLLIVLPLFLALAALAFGSVAVHERAMRTMVGERDLRSAQSAAAALSALGRAPDDQVLRETLDALRGTSEATVILVEDTGHLVYYSGQRPAEEATSHPGVAEALSGGSGVLYQPDGPDRREQIVAYTPVRLGASAGALVVAEPWSEVVSPWLSTSLFAPLLLVPAIAITLLALWLAVERIVRPLQRLDAQVTALGWGKFDAVEAPVGGIEEIRELQKAVRHMATQIRNYQQGMQDYLGAITTAQEEERKRLARELHDEAIQGLVVLVQRVQMARRNLARDPDAVGAQLAEVQSLLEAIMDDVRRFSRALRPIYLEEAGLVAALEGVATDAEQRGLEVRLDVEGEPWRLPPDAELALYRIVQEALSNVARHAQASRVQVRLAYDQDVTIRVQDDGRGFTANQRVTDLAAAGHYGLMGMQERAQLVGAHLTVASQPGAGTTVQVCYPGKKTGK